METKETNNKRLTWKRSAALQGQLQLSLSPLGLRLGWGQTFIGNL
jgi:hypothetical protein